MDWEFDEDIFDERESDVEEEVEEEETEETLEEYLDREGILYDKEGVLDEVYARRYQKEVREGNSYLTDEQKAKDENIEELLKVVMNEAIEERTTDIQVSVWTKDVYVRHRVDSKMKLHRFIDRDAFDALSCRVKYLSGMEVGESRVPQDGRMTYRYGKESYDIRVSTIPTSKGENISLRILYSNELNASLDSLEIRDKVMEKYRRVLGSREGLILLTGPTGSGKTTTLFTSIKELQKRYNNEKNIMTIENPVEYEVDGVIQSQVNLLRGYDFGDGLRTILRQNPDIILVGEIRDQVTAQTAVRASNTGHLVFSTLHASDAVSTALVLKQLGVEPYQISNSLKMVMNQRLSGKLCTNCRSKAKFASKEERERFPGLVKIYESYGCEQCNWTGRDGLVLLVEMVEVDELFSELIEKDMTALEMKRALEGSDSYYSLMEEIVNHVNEGRLGMEEAEHLGY